MGKWIRTFIESMFTLKIKSAYGQEFYDTYAPHVEKEGRALWVELDAFDSCTKKKISFLSTKKRIDTLYDLKHFVVYYVDKLSNN